MDVTKPYEFIGFGAMEVTKPYKFLGFGAMEVTKPYKFIGFWAIDGLDSAPAAGAALTRAPSPRSPLGTPRPADVQVG